MYNGPPRSTLRRGKWTPLGKLGILQTLPPVPFHYAKWTGGPFSTAKNGPGGAILHRGGPFSTGENGPGGLFSTGENGPGARIILVVPPRLAPPPTMRHELLYVLPYGYVPQP